MTQVIYRQINDLVLKAGELARIVGINYLFQPGLVKEMIAADIPGHQLIHSKYDTDACAYGNPDEKYEYLSCKKAEVASMTECLAAPLINGRNL